MKRYPMNIGPGTYDHLDRNNPFSTFIPMKALVGLVDSLNYGAHRFLSALMEYRLADNPEDPLGIGLRDLLNRGVW